jgi:hypothetical protein
VCSCEIFHQVKAEHKSPTSLLQSLEVLEWQWDEIAMGIFLLPAHEEQSMRLGWSQMNLVKFLILFLCTPQNLASELILIYLCRT